MLQALIFYTHSTNGFDLKTILRKVNFIGTKYQQNQFLVGPSFFNALSFVGCSPSLKLKPEKNKPFCYVEIVQTINWQIYAGVNSRSPKCPSCGERIQNWATNRKLLSILITCDACQRTQKIITWSSGKNTMAFKNGFMVWDVFENEAAPTADFLQYLKQATGSDWQIGFYRQ